MLVWPISSMRRRIRKRLPTYLSVGLIVLLEFPSPHGALVLMVNSEAPAYAVIEGNCMASTSPA
jgi:hypothetical protein